LAEEDAGGVGAQPSDSCKLYPDSVQRLVLRGEKAHSRAVILGVTVVVALPALGLLLWAVDRYQTRRQCDPEIVRANHRLEEKWAAEVVLVANTPRMTLAAPLTELQEIQRTFRDRPPRRAADQYCLASSHGRMGSGGGQARIGDSQACIPCTWTARLRESGSRKKPRLTDATCLPRRAALLYEEPTPRVSRAGASLRN
jgi:hypothetical protein